MDLSDWEEYTTVPTVMACLAVGYVIKMWVKDVDNKYIPTILAILGAGVNCWVHGAVTPQIVIGGMVSGLASTGLHQVFKQYIDKR